jgi:Holliday junction resolvase-like predicted endonuclease
VKEKTGPALGDPLEMVDAEKQRRLQRAAETWLTARPELERCVAAFDVVAFREGRLVRVQDAF